MSRYLEEVSPPSSKTASISSDPLSENGSTLLEKFHKVADQRDAARQDLSYAMETIKELKCHVLGLNQLLSNTQRELESRKTSTLEKEPRVEVTSGETWIENTWRCSPPSLHSVLRDGEREWQSGNPQRTLNMMFTCMKSSRLDFEGQMMCRLLISAVFHSSGKNDQSMQFADEVVENCEEHYRNNPIQAGEIIGIAQFLRGKNFLSEGNWRDAYWAFTRATSNPKYQSKARQCKGIAAEFFPEEESIPHVPSVAPLFTDKSESSTETSPSLSVCF